MGIITVPLPVMVALNGPLRFPFIYQTTLFVAVWSWPVSPAPFATDDRCSSLSKWTIAE